MPVHPLWFVAVLVVAIVIGGIVLVVWAVSQSAMGKPHNPSPSEPQDVLARRFAAGEITAEEYQRARDLLGRGPGQASR